MSLKKTGFKRIALFILTLNVSCIPAQYDITTETLLQEMLDRDALAKADKHPFKTLQASSYSRKAVSPDRPGWFDNADAKQYIGVETIDGRKERALMDVEGPGVIVRF